MECKAKIEDYFVTVTKEKKPQIVVKFKVKNGEDEETLNWFGGFSSDKAKEVTKAALKFMGFVGTNAATLAGGVQSKLLNVEKVYDVTVEESEYNGKVQRRVAFINSGSLANKLSVDQATKVMAGLNLESLFRDIPNMAPTQEFDYNEPLPF